MALVTVKNKFQVVIPLKVRQTLAVNVGDIFEADVEGGRITLTPKSVVDRGIAQGLADFQAGRAHGPFESAKALMKSLNAEAGKLEKRNRRGIR
jgi:AbrB family looped-hinge helix DNA binding protein